MTTIRTSDERLREIVDELYEIPEGLEILKRVMAGIKNGIRVDLTGLEYYESLDALRKQIPDTMVEKYMKTLRSPHASR